MEELLNIKNGLFEVHFIVKKIFYKEFSKRSTRDIIDNYDVIHVFKGRGGCGKTHSSIVAKKILKNIGIKIKIVDLNGKKEIINEKFDGYDCIIFDSLNEAYDIKNIISQLKDLKDSNSDLPFILNTRDLKESNLLSDEYFLLHNPDWRLISDYYKMKHISIINKMSDCERNLWKILTKIYSKNNESDYRTLNTFLKILNKNKIRNFDVSFFISWMRGAYEHLIKDVFGKGAREHWKELKKDIWNSGKNKIDLREDAEYFNILLKNDFLRLNNQMVEFRDISMAAGIIIINMINFILKRKEQLNMSNKQTILFSIEMIEDFISKSVPPSETESDKNLFKGLFYYSLLYRNINIYKSSSKDSNLDDNSLDFINQFINLSGVNESNDLAWSILSYENKFSKIVKHFTLNELINYDDINDVVPFFRIQKIDFSYIYYLEIDYESFISLHKNRWNDNMTRNYLLYLICKLNSNYYYDHYESLVSDINFLSSNFLNSINDIQFNEAIKSLLLEDDSLEWNYKVMRITQLIQTQSLSQDFLIINKKLFDKRLHNTITYELINFPSYLRGSYSTEYLKECDASFSNRLTRNMLEIISDLSGIGTEYECNTIFLDFVNKLAKCFPGEESIDYFDKVKYLKERYELKDIFIDDEIHLDRLIYSEFREQFTIIDFENIHENKLFIMYSNLPFFCREESLQQKKYNIINKSNIIFDGKELDILSAMLLYSNDAYKQKELVENYMRILKKHGITSGYNSDIANLEYKEYNNFYHLVETLNVIKNNKQFSGSYKSNVDNDIYANVNEDDFCCDLNYSIYRISDETEDIYFKWEKTYHIYDSDSSPAEWNIIQSVIDKEGQIKMIIIAEQNSFYFSSESGEFIPMPKTDSPNWNPLIMPNKSD